MSLSGRHIVGKADGKVPCPCAATTLARGRAEVHATINIIGVCGGMCPYNLLILEVLHVCFANSGLFHPAAPLSPVAPLLTRIHVDCSWEALLVVDHLCLPD